ncbi:transposase [Mesorhizobium sp. M1365]|uniref:transposase n=1 Tax=Mesorhizobium sp. M1365 TaxID=2957090 RepID=UPI003335CD19
MRSTARFTSSAPKEPNTRHSALSVRRIIAETLEPNAIISEVARRYGLRPQQVFAWRREARKQAASVQQDSPALLDCSPHHLTRLSVSGSGLERASFCRVEA